MFDGDQILSIRSFGIITVNHSLFQVFWLSVYYPIAFWLKKQRTHEYMMCDGYRLAHSFSFSDCVCTFRYHSWAHLVHLCSVYMLNLKCSLYLFSPNTRRLRTNSFNISSIHRIPHWFCPYWPHRIWCQLKDSQLISEGLPCVFSSVPLTLRLIPNNETCTFLVCSCSDSTLNPFSLGS